MQALLRACRPEGNDLFTISTDLAPSPAARGALVERLNQLDYWLMPAGTEAIRKRVSLMLFVGSLKNETDDEREVRKRGYLMALAPHPLFAVNEACDRYGLRAGEGGHPKFLPIPRELDAKATEIAARWRAERKLISRILSAKVVEPARRRTAEEIARVRAAAAGVRASAAEAALKASKVPMPPVPRR